jgi:hypothetical protein
MLTPLVVYAQSLLFGDSYRAAGWYTVEQNRCSTVYDSGDGETVYFGFAYLDEHDTLRTWVTEPERTSDASLRAANNSGSPAGRDQRHNDLRRYHQAIFAFAMPGRPLLRLFLDRKCPVGVISDHGIAGGIAGGAMCGRGDHKKRRDGDGHERGKESCIRVAIHRLGARWTGTDLTAAGS